MGQKLRMVNIEKHLMGIVGYAKVPCGFRVLQDSREQIGKSSETDFQSVAT